MALVDPFIPQRIPQRIPQSEQPRPAPRPPLPNLSLRQPRASAVQAKTSVAQPSAPVAMPLPPPARRKTFQPPSQPKNKFKTVGQSIAMLLWASALGFGAYSQTIGELAIAAYAVVALLLRLSSQTSFVLALCAFAATACVQLLRPASSLAANFAVYAFLLLVVGSISLALEVRQQAKWQQPRGHRQGRK